MNDRFFVLIYGTSIKGKDFTHFSSYHNVQDVVDLVRDWLERFLQLREPGAVQPLPHPGV